MVISQVKIYMAICFRIFKVKKVAVMQIVWNSKQSIYSCLRSFGIFLDFCGPEHW